MLLEAIVRKVLVAMLSLSCESSFPGKRSFCDRTLAFIVGQESPISVDSIEWCFESLRILLPNSA